MCGIAGIMQLTDGTRPLDPGIAERMGRVLFHRGPDEDGIFSTPSLSMASRRLSIVGLADGRQPISNEDRTVSVVFNGELFDYPQMRTQLMGRGHTFRTGCDTEILPHLYEDHGEEMLEKLRGQFAFALWDEKKRQLILARDRFGICPLYWTRQTGPEGDFLLFASEIKALLASGMVQARPDPRGINQVFTFFAMPGPVTCFQGIQALLPGHYLKVQSGNDRIQDKIYWQIDFPDQGQEIPLDRRSSKKIVDQFEELMLAAVEKRLRADVPVVSYLSGGVDSSMVVALASHLRRREGKSAIPTFTISIQDPDLNERAEAMGMARHAGGENVVLDCGRSDVLQSYPELIRAVEGPVIDTACSALLLLARKVHARGYKVALTGEGADEWLAGYSWYKIQKLWNILDVIPGLKLSQIIRRAYLKWSGTPSFPWSSVHRVQEALGGPNAWMNVYGLFSTNKLWFFSKPMWENLGDHFPYQDLQLNLERARRWHPFHRSLYLGSRVMLPGLLLSAKGDRVAMNSSVETRYPFLDEEVFAFLARLDPRWKLNGFREKYILRLLADRWVPRSIAWRRKAMFRAPFDGFHTASLPTFVDQLLSPDSLRKTGYFDAQAVRHWRQAFRNMRVGSNQRTMIEMGLVGVVATQLWHHIFIDGSLADIPSWSVARGPWSAANKVAVSSDYGTPTTDFARTNQLVRMS